MSAHRFSEGAVRPPADATIAQKAAQLERNFPASRGHRNALRLLGSQVTYAEIVDLPHAGIVGVCLIRFSSSIEAAFGFTREVAIYYSQYTDLQTRTHAALREHLRTGLPRDVTPDVVLLSAPDDGLELKADDWSRPTLAIVPLPDLGSKEASESADAFISILQQRLFERDLFSETTPVSGRDFFGRQRVLQSLARDIEAQRVPAIHGLRKTGKTSLLHALREHLAETDDALVFVLRDLESLPAPNNGAIRELVPDLADALRLALRERGFRNVELADLPTDASIAQFRRALLGVLERERAPLRIVVALDEIEYLCPPGLVEQATPAADDVPQFLGALRSVQQENKNFTFAISGLTTSITEASTLYGRPNPIFAWGKPYFLPPFDIAEAIDLVRTIGYRMGTAWDDASIDTLVRETGGHPYLLRSLASDVARSLPIKPDQRRVYKSNVERTAVDWRRRLAGTREAMLSDLYRYYPEEAALLELLSEAPEDFSLLAGESDIALAHLLQLGLLHNVTRSEFDLTDLARVLGIVDSTDRARR